MKHLLIILLILTALNSYSQGTIQITEYQAKEAIKNAQRVEVLSSQLHTQGLIISEYEILTGNLQSKVSSQALSLKLWEKNYSLLETRLKAEQKKKQGLFEKILIGIGVFSAGYLVGSL